MLYFHKTTTQFILQIMSPQMKVVEGICRLQHVEDVPLCSRPFAKTLRINTQTHIVTYMDSFSGLGFRTSSILGRSLQMFIVRIAAAEKFRY